MESLKAEQQLSQLLTAGGAGEATELARGVDDLRSRAACLTTSDSHDKMVERSEVNREVSAMVTSSRDDWYDSTS